MRNTGALVILINLSLVWINQTTLAEHGTEPNASSRPTDGGDSTSEVTRKLISCATKALTAAVKEDLEKNPVTKEFNVAQLDEHIPSMVTKALDELKMQDKARSVDQILALVTRTVSTSFMDLFRYRMVKGFVTASEKFEMGNRVRRLFDKANFTSFARGALECAPIILKSANLFGEDTLVDFEYWKLLNEANKFKIAQETKLNNRTPELFDVPRGGGFREISDDTKDLAKAIKLAGKTAALSGPTSTVGKFGKVAGVVAKPFKKAALVFGAQDVYEKLEDGGNLSEIQKEQLRKREKLKKDVGPMLGPVLSGMAAITDKGEVGLGWAKWQVGGSSNDPNIFIQDPEKSALRSRQLQETAKGSLLRAPWNTLKYRLLNLDPGK